MSDKNEVEFRVKVTDEGLAPLASTLGRVDDRVDELGKTSATTGRQLGDIGTTAGRVDDQVDVLGKTAATTGKQLDGIGKNADPALETVYRRGRKAAEGIDSISLQLQRVQNGLIALGLGDSLVNMIQGVAETADGYNNLAARIQLATGAGDAFEQSMTRVEQIALDTNSSLEGTGDLFARLTDAGKSAGLGTQEAISQALSLTESINQAVQVSGAGAQASDAALRQLIQGLQGGALRGDEFNSVMEQSPRLAKALADGLGVTTGQLRAMANEGRLTSDVVIQSLKSQADTLKAEFETLPPTVGRAVQNLSTAWTVYVGNADKATGASRTAAQAIDLLAENLDTVAGYLVDAGQAAAAFAALRLAQTFLGIGAAAATSATAIAANTAAMTAANAASTGAAAGVGRFAAILSGLKTFTLLGLVTNFQDIGTWIGEGAAKLAGYKDRTEELERAERSRLVVADEQRKVVEAQAAAVKAAADRQFELSSAAQSSIAAFDDLVKGGKSAADAVGEIGKDFDLSTSPGIVNAAAVLDKLAADGKISAEQFSAAWGAALTGQDLQAFEVQARAALAGTARESERLAAIMDGTLREAIRRSGGDFDVLSGGMSKAARSAINDVDTIVNGLDRLKAQGLDAGQTLELSLNKAIKTADSQAAIEALRDRVEQLRKVLGDQVANGLLKQIEEQAKKAAGGVTELDSALKKLGVTSDSDLKKAAAETRGLYEEVVRAGGSAREQAAAFEKMAAAAVASGDESSLSFVKSKAAANGFEVAIDAAGKATVRAMREGSSSTTALTQGIKAASDAAAEYVGWADRMAERNRRVGSKEAAAEERKRLNVDGDGFTLDKSGNRLAMGGDLTTLTGIKNFLEQSGLDEEQAKRVAMEFSDGKGSIPYFSNAGQIKYGGKSSTMSEALLKAAERVTFGGASVGGSGAKVGGTVGGNTSHTVTLNLGGRSTRINTATAGDAESLTQFLTSLQEAADRA